MFISKDLNCLFCIFFSYCRISLHTTPRDSPRIFSVRDSCKEWRGEGKEESFVQKSSSLGTTEHPQAHVLIPTNAFRLLCYYSPNKAMILEPRGHGLLAGSSWAGAGLRFPYCVRYSVGKEKRREKEKTPRYSTKASCLSTLLLTRKN